MRNLANKFSHFYDNLRRRKIINTFVLYIVSCWVILQVSAIAFPIFGLDNKYFHWLLITFIVLFPVALTISWFFNFTGKGFVRVAPFTERRSLNNIAPHIDRRASQSHKGARQPDLKDGWFIYAESGPLEGLEYKITDSIIIGRAIECDITLLRSYISRNHSRLQLTSDGLMIDDLDSSNGTFVNGKRISGSQKLFHGDEINFKDMMFSVREYVGQIRDEALLDQTTMLDKS